MLEPCLAYLDPGAGSILLQFLIGGLMGAGLFFRRSIAGVFRLFRRGDKLAASEPRSGNS